MYNNETSNVESEVTPLPMAEVPSLEVDIPSTLADLLQELDA